MACSIAWAAGWVSSWVMRYSLVSRDVIADSIETFMQAMCYDALVTVVGCDKNMPGALMAQLRLNRPSILVLWRHHRRRVSQRQKA